MIPIKDTIRSSSFPLVNWLLILANALVFLYEQSLPPDQLDRLISTFAVVPARLFHGPVAGNPLVFITLFTSMFLHGGWLHIISNMWALFIFGDNVEDRMGSGRYLAFYLICGIVAGLTQAYIGPTSRVPSIGASGAIAGVLAAYLLLFPRARVVTLILIIIIPWFVNIPAVLFILIWIGLQFFNGLAVLGSSQAVGGIAYWAHIGGFLCGLLLVWFFARKQPRVYPDEYRPW